MVGAFETLCREVGVDPWAEPYHRVLRRHEDDARLLRSVAHVVLDAAIITGTGGRALLARLLLHCTRDAHLARRRLELVRMRKRDNL